MEAAHGQESRGVGPLKGHQQLPGSLPVLGEQRFAHLPEDLRPVGHGIVVSAVTAPKSRLVKIDQVILHSPVHHGPYMAVAQRQRLVETGRLTVISHDLRPRQDRQERRQ